MKSYLVFYCINLAMAWIDYEKAFDMVPHSWIIECLELFGIAENVRKFMWNSMRPWKQELTSSGESLGDVHIQRGIFQGDSLSPLLFVLCMIPLTLTLRKVAASYEWGNKEFRIICQESGPNRFTSTNCKYSQTRVSRISSDQAK